MLTTTTAPAAVLLVLPVVGEIEACCPSPVPRCRPVSPKQAGLGPGVHGPGPRCVCGRATWLRQPRRSQVARWRLLTGGNFGYSPRFPVTDQAVYARLVQASTAPWRGSCTRPGWSWPSAWLPISSPRVPLATEVLVLGETTLRRVARLLRGRLPRLRLIWADAGYARRLVTWVPARTGWGLAIVRRPRGRQRFEVLPRRGVVVHTFGWLGRSLRLSKD